MDNFCCVSFLLRFFSVFRIKFVIVILIIWWILMGMNDEDRWRLRILILFLKSLPNFYDLSKSFLKKHDRKEISVWNLKLHSYTQKKDLIESKKMICLKDLLWFKEMICLNEIKFAWFKQNIFKPNKYLFESN